VLHFPDKRGFRATSVFVATWDRVGHFRSKSDGVNTFQVALASDGKDSFAFFHYAKNELRWIRGDGKVNWRIR
jgi:nidogen (entactin)